MLDLKSLVPWGQKNNPAPVRSADRFDPFQALRSDFDRVFDDFFRQRTGFDVGGLGKAALAPQLDVSETEREMIVRAELPGVDEEDVDVTLSGDVLTIKGEKRYEHENGDNERRYVERHFGSFARSLRLPFEAWDQDVAADMKNGVLTVTIPKPKNAQRETKRIAVRTA